MKKSTSTIIAIALAFVAALQLVSCKADVKVPEHVEVKKLPVTYVAQKQNNLETVTEKYTFDTESGSVSYEKSSSVYGVIYAYEGTYTKAEGALSISTSLEENFTLENDTIVISIEGIERTLAKNEAGFYTDGHVRLIASNIADGASYTLKNNMISKGHIYSNGDGTFALRGNVTFTHDYTLTDELLVIDGVVFSK